MGHLCLWTYNVYITFSIALADWEIEQITHQPPFPWFYHRVDNKLESEKSSVKRRPMRC